MKQNNIIRDSEELAARLAEVLSVPGYDNTARNRLSYLACSISLEHAHATRALLGVGLFPSSLVVLRAQFEALVRAVWIFYAATDGQIEKLGATLTLDAEQSAKNLPSANEMLALLSSKAPAQPYEALSRFKESSWKVLNSFVHAGIHPLQRHEHGYPVHIIEQCLRNSNGFAVMASMQAAVLTGRQQLVGDVGRLGRDYKSCLPSELEA
ncbi:hypothetical protein [Undibacterium sp.]|uniref:DUF6988 family protein n=1 Tax=Undibacterium sp. TaxID=1914977 RepID=UPI0025ED86D3|nr:hypothetical protein [Undibacterium sp.]